MSELNIPVAPPKNPVAEMKKKRFQQNISAALGAVGAAQDPMWAVGVAGAPAFIASLIGSEENPTKALGSILLGFMAFTRTEGMTVGRAGVINEILDHLSEGLMKLPQGSTRRERERLIMLLSQVEMETYQSTPRAYEAAFGALVREAGQTKPLDLPGLAPIAEAFLLSFQQRIAEAVALAKAEERVDAAEAAQDSPAASEADVASPTESAPEMEASAQDADTSAEETSAEVKETASA